jgi:tRNA G37 N-methylase TrmD
MNLIELNCGDRKRLYQFRRKQRKDKLEIRRRDLRDGDLVSGGQQS